MTSIAVRPRQPLRGLLEAAPPIVLGLVLVLAASGGITAGLGAQGPSARLALFGGLALLAMLALAVLRYDAAVGVGLLLMGIVRFEPAPVDGVMAIIMAVAIVTGRFDLRSAPLWATGLVGIFLALNLLGCIEAIEAGRAALFMSVTVYLCLLGLWTAGYARTMPRARMILGLWIVVGVASAVMGTLALYVAFPGSDLMTNFFGDRAKALFKDPNVYGPFLIPAAILLLHELLEPRLLRLARLLKLLALGVLVVGVIVSYSRAAWLNLGVGVVVMLAVLPLRRGGTFRAGLLLLAVIACLGAAAVTVTLTGSSSFLEQRAQVQSYDSQRFGAQRRGIELSQTHPLGIGPGQFEVISPVSAHSTYVRALAEEGFTGAAALGALLLGTLIIAMRNVVLGRDTGGLSSTALLAAWCGLLANSVFVDTLHWRHLWLLAGLIWAGSMIPPVAAQASSSAGARSPT